MAAKKTSKTAITKSTTKKPVAKAKKTAASNKKSAAASGKKTATKTNKAPAAKAKSSSKAKTKSKSKSELNASKSSVKWLAASGTGNKPKISFEDRERMISEAAFVISKKRDPNVGGPEVDWLQAEAVIDLIFSASE